MSPTRRRYLRVVGAALAAPLALSRAASAGDVDVRGDGVNTDGDGDDSWAWYDETGRLVDSRRDD